MAAGLDCTVHIPSAMPPILHRMSFLAFAWLAMVCGSVGALEMPVGDNIFVDQPAVKGAPADSVLNPTWGVGSWIWAPKTHDKQTCRLWRSFEIPRGSTVARAKIHIGVDNGYRLMLDGRELGTGSDWRSITEYDISLLLVPGRHILGATPSMTTARRACFSG